MNFISEMGSLKYMCSWAKFSVEMLKLHLSIYVWVRMTTCCMSIYLSIYE